MRVTPATTLANQVASVLRARLRQKYTDGGQLPSETALAEELGASRGTVRQALAILQREGIIYRRHGSGTFANPRALGIQTPIDRAMEFTQLIREAGLVPRIQMMGIQHEGASCGLANRLEIAEGAEIIAVEKLFLADERPAILARESIPNLLVQSAYEESDLSGPVFTFLQKCCGARVDFSLAAIAPCAAEERAARLLKVEPGRALISLDEVFFTEQGKPVAQVDVLLVDPIIRFNIVRKVV